jgi:hypothetical protein
MTMPGKCCATVHGARGKRQKPTSSGALRKALVTAGFVKAYVIRHGGGGALTFPALALTCTSWLHMFHTYRPSTTDASITESVLAGRICEKVVNAFIAPLNQVQVDMLSPTLHTVNAPTHATPYPI